MSPEDCRRAREACREVLIQYLTAVDRHEATTALRLFTEDANIVARGERLHGRDAIGRFLAEREADTARRTAHIIANELLEHVDADRATLRARVVLLLREPEGSYRTDQVVETRQTFERDDSGWRIALRDESPLHPDSP